MKDNQNGSNSIIKLAHWVVTHKTIVGIIIILLFSIPLLVVHLLFKWDSNCYWFQAEWDAGDIIAYIAGFEAFIGTSMLSVLALWQNQRYKQDSDMKDQKLLALENEKIRLSNMPQFIIQTADFKKIIDNDVQLGEEYKKMTPLDYIKTHGFFIQNGMTMWIPADKIPVIDSTRINRFISIVNCGNNTAHQVKLNMKIGDKVYKDEKTASIKKDDEIYLYIGIDLSITEDVDMQLVIRYFDCFQNVYEQAFILKNTSDNLLLITFSDAKLIKKNSSMQLQ